MKTGVVKFFNSEKGFGFIIPDDNSDEVFFHHTGSKERGFNNGQKVQYELGSGNKGPLATNITKI